MAAKELCDSFCTNVHYARVGGISLRELNTLELEFLFLIDWRLAISADELQQYYANLVRQSQLYFIPQNAVPKGPISEDNLRKLAAQAQAAGNGPVGEPPPADAVRQDRDWEETGQQKNAPPQEANSMDWTDEG